MALKFLNELDKSIKIPEVFYYKGVCLNYLKQNDLAIKNYKKAISLKKDYLEPYIQLGHLYKNIDKIDEALEILLNGLKYAQQKELTHTNISEIYYLKKQYDLSIKHAREALKSNKNNYFAVINLANSFMEQGLVEKGVEELENIAAQNDISIICNNLGFGYRLLGNYEKAISNYQKAISLNPNNHEAFFNLSHIQLSLNNFQEGWLNYEHRWGTKKFAYKKLDIKKPLWNSKLGYERVLIWAEQGIGEQILFSSIIPELKSKFKKILIAVNDKLVPLFQERFAGIEVCPISKKINENDFDFHLPIGSLGRYFRSDRKSFSENVIQNSNRRPTNIKNKKFKCAISWVSSNNEFEKNKSIKLNDLVDILYIKEFEFFNVQYTDVQKEVDSFFNNHNILINDIGDIDPYNDLLNLNKFLISCDFLITVSNTNAHLAAAAGVPTYLLLPQQKGSFWYWSNEYHDKNLWYPSVVKFQQNHEGNWVEPIKKLKTYLENKYKIN